MIWFGKSFFKFFRSFIKFNKAPQYKDMQLGQGNLVGSLAGHPGASTKLWWKVETVLLQSRVCADTDILRDTRSSWAVLIVLDPDCLEARRLLDQSPVSA